MRPTSELLQHYRKHIARLEKVIEVQRLTAGELELGPLLRRIMEITQSVMEAEACSLFLLDADSGDLVFHVVLGESGDKLKEIYRIPRGSGIAGWCVEHGRPVLLADAYTDPRFNPDYDRRTGFRTRNMICVPLHTRNGVIGVCQVINRREGVFSQADLQLLESLALITAAAIDNARTHERLLRRRLLEHDLDLAARLQQSFLPSRAPDVPGFEAAFHLRTAFEIGGDFYDALPLSDGRCAYLIGDVAGKGVASALMMARILRDLRQAIAAGGTAGEILTCVNNDFSRIAEGGMFVTLVLMLLDPEGGRIQIANAGHTRPARFSHREARLEQGASGPPLGILSACRYATRVLTLEKGESILLYSDGVTEAVNEAGQMAGEKELLAWLRQAPVPAGQCIAFLRARLERFRGHRRPADDITLLALTRN